MSIDTFEHLDASVELASVGVGDVVHPDSHSCEYESLSLDGLEPAVDINEVDDLGDVPRKWH